MSAGSKTKTRIITLRTLYSDMPSSTFTINESITMRLLVEQDANVVFSAIKENRSRLREWLVWVDDTQSVADTTKFIKNAAVEFETSKAFRFGIFYSNQYAGIVDLHEIDLKNSRGYIGYWLDQKYEGKGIMSAAVKKILEFGFEELKLHRIEIHVAPNNLKSRAIPERLGFKFDGQLREFEWIHDGKYLDTQIYSLLRSEWISK